MGFFVRPFSFDITLNPYVLFSKPLCLNLWQYDRHLQPGDNMPEELIDLHNIHSHAVWLRVTIGEHQAWVTVMLDQVSNPTSISCNLWLSVPSQSGIQCS